MREREARNICYLSLCSDVMSHHVQRTFLHVSKKLNDRPLVSNVLVEATPSF
jgi:hypothetical protein